MSSPNSQDSNVGIAIWHPTTAGGKAVKGHIKTVPANHRCRSAAGAPGRIIADYQLVDDSGNKIHSLDAGAQVVLEVGYTQGDLNRAGGNTNNLGLVYWNEASGAWVKFDSSHGFKVVTDGQKYHGFLGYLHVDKNVPIDPPTGTIP
jgi:hypothetical protein